MNLDVRGVFRDAWSMWQRDRGVLTAVAGFFLFLPQLAYHLFGPENAAVAAIRAAGKLDADAQFRTVMQVYAENLPLLFAIAISMVFGALAILMFYLDRAERSIGAMLLAALRRMPSYFVLTVIVDIAASAGVQIIYILLPCMYLIGRLLLAGPIFAQAGVGPIDAMIQSFRMTRGRGLVLAGFATLIVFAGLLPLPAIALGNVLDRAPLANPVSGIIIDAIAAAIAVAAMLGGILIRIALYRRIGASNGI